MALSHARHTLIPSLTVKGAREAVNFYTSIFGAREHCPAMTGPDGRMMHGELMIGDHLFFLNDEFPEMGGLSPQTLGGTPVTLQIYVEDADKTYAAALAAGAKSLMAPADMFWGDRYGMIVDPWGHRWGVGTPKEEVSPEEMAERVRKFQEQQQCEPQKV